MILQAPTSKAKQAATNLQRVVIPAIIDRMVSKFVLALSSRVKAIHCVTRFFPGNRHDSTPLKEKVERMEQRYGSADRIRVLDRGMVCDAHLSWLQARKSRYIVGTPKSQLKIIDAQLLSGKWSQVREGLEMQLVAAESGQEAFILCRSQDRVAKERAMRERFEAWMEKGLSAIKAGCEKRSCQVGMIERRIGRLLAKNSRATGLCEVKVTAGDKGQARLTWSKKGNRVETAQRREGPYVLRSNVNDWSAEDLWRAYICN
jgi:transposase